MEIKIIRQDRVNIESRANFEDMSLTILAPYGKDVTKVVEQGRKCLEAYKEGGAGQCLRDCLSSGGRP